MKYSNTKKQTQINYNIQLEALNQYIENTVLKSEAFKKLEQEIINSLDDCYNKNNMFYFDESGMLNSAIDIYIPDELCIDDNGDFDRDVLESVVETLESSYCVYFQSTDYANGPREYRVSQCLGMPTIFNENSGRHYYDIYSQELELSIDKVINRDHGFALIEQAMRNAGVYENIVTVDYYGNFVSFLTVPKEIVDLSDNELQEYIDKIEESEENY